MKSGISKVGGCLIALLLAACLLTACTAGVRLSNTDRAALDRQAVIHVVHYETPLPEIKSDSKKPPPAALTVRKHAAADPAVLIAQSFSRLLAKKNKLKNLRVESRPLPLPVAKEASLYRKRFKHGLVLEIWVDDWKFGPLPADTKVYLMTLNARSRLARVEDGRVLWSTGSCRVGGDGANNRDMRLAEPDLTGGIKLRKLLAAARDECARQLMRAFDEHGQ